MKGSRLTTKSERDALARTIKSRLDSFEKKTLGGPCPKPGLGKKGKLRFPC